MGKEKCEFVVCGGVRERERERERERKIEGARCTRRRLQQRHIFRRKFKLLFGVRKHLSSI